MAKNQRQQKAGGEVLRNAKEITQIEQYWHVLGRAKPRKPPKEYNYVEELAHLQLELIKLQEWVHMQGLRLCVIFEGRDAAGSRQVGAQRCWRAVVSPLCGRKSVKIRPPGFHLFSEQHRSSPRKARNP